MDIDTLCKATGAGGATGGKFAPLIDRVMQEFEINTKQRQAMFLAQIGHESGGLKWTREIWGPTPAQSRYEGRADLGNTQAGDGSKFRGRGLLQVTGRANYKRVGDALGVDLVEYPELLEQPDLAAKSAAYFWSSHGLNEIADAGDFEKVTRRINGGLNGYAERLALYKKATEAIA